MKRMTADEYESELARLRTRLDWAERAAKRWYERNRRLENRVRNAIVIGEHIDTDKLYALRVSVPKGARKGWRR